jgi:hypothetical protein
MKKQFDLSKHDFSVKNGVLLVNHYKKKSKVPYLF